MDYLEGFLIGSVWSDTDYRSRRHVNAHILLAAAMGALFVFLVLFPQRQTQLILIDWPLSLVLLIALVFLTPIFAILYRRLPFYVRPLVILIFAFKYLLLFYVLVHYFIPLVTFEKESIFTLLFARMDDHIEKALVYLAESGGILATVGGVVAGGLWVIGEGLAVICLLILVPLIAILLFKGLQHGLDRLVKYLLDRQLTGVNPALVGDIPWQGEEDVASSVPPLTLPQLTLPPEQPRPAERDFPSEEVLPDRQELSAKPAISQVKVKKARPIQKTLPVRVPKPTHKRQLSQRVRRDLRAVGGALALAGAALLVSGKKTGAWILKKIQTLKAKLMDKRSDRERRVPPPRSRSGPPGKKIAGFFTRLGSSLEKIAAKVGYAIQRMVGSLKVKFGGGGRKGKKQAIRRSRLRLPQMPPTRVGKGQPDDPERG